MKNVFAQLFTAGVCRAPMACGALTILSSAAGAATFTNVAAITIPDSGAGTPYPSTNIVSGLGGTISTVAVRLNSLSHTWADDIEVLLVSPTGQKVLLLSDAGGGTAPNNVTLTFLDTAAAGLSDSGPLATGTFKPTNFETTTDSFAAPAPAGPYGTTLSAFNGQTANGAWALYVMDDGPGDVGTLAGGWSLTITTTGGGAAAPTISNIPDQVTTVNTATAAISFTVNDADTPVANLTLSKASSNPTLVPTDNIVFGGSGSNRSVTVSPTANQTGTATITVSVSDGTTTVSDSFVVTVDGLLAGAKSYTNTAAITIPGAGAGTPYPSTINVAGLGGTISALTLILKNLSHTYPDDVDILLVGPGGQKVMVFSDVGGVWAINNLTVTLSDTAASALPDTGPLVSGTFKPTDASPGEVRDLFPAPAPAGPYGANLSAFNGLTANGIWSLYVHDDGAGDAGGIADGWSLSVSTTGGGPANTAPTISDISNQLTAVNTPTPAIPFTVGDVEVAAGSLLVSGHSSNPALVPNGNIGLGGSGANRTVTVSPAANQSGSATITVTVSDGSLSASDTFVLTVNTGSPPPAAGLEGTYFDNLDFTSQKLTRIDSTINFDWGNGSPDPAIAADTFSARWVGQIEPLYSQTYTFYALTDDGFRLWVNNQLIINSWIVQAPTERASTPIALTAGTKYDLKIEYYDNGGGAVAKLSWSSASQAKGIVPAGRLFRPPVTSPGGNTPPTISNIPDQSTTVGTATGAIPFTVGDVEAAAGSLTVSGSSGNATLVPNGNIVLGGSGANRTVTVTPTANQSGNATITVSVSDGQFSASDSFVLAVSTTAPTGVATGPLVRLATNPRYFTDGSGKAIYLTGSHTWGNNRDYGVTDPPPPLDFTAYLNFLQSHHHNFFRLWTWELPHSEQGALHIMWWRLPFPWPRTGPGVANDGKAKFDLAQFNQPYFDRLRARVTEARNRGMYVAIMLWDGFGLQTNPHSTDGFPFTAGNNINGISSDGITSQRLVNAAVTAVQEAYARKVIDTVNDLDNVLYEIVNEAGGYSTAWQYHMINFIKQYEAVKPKQHPVGMTYQYTGGSDATLYNSPADWISTSEQYPVSDGTKVIINDTDHSYYYTGLVRDGPAAQQTWVWKNFLSGNNTLFMDPYLVVWEGRNAPTGTTPDPYWEVLRNSLGYTRLYAEKMNLAAMTPRPTLASSGACLANPGSEYLVYSGGGGFTLTVVAGTYRYEWFNPTAGTIVASGTLTLATGNRSFTAPFSGDSVLYLKINTIP